MSTVTETPTVIANRLIRSARRRAPSFILLNHIFSAELDSLALTDDVRRQVVDAARQILQAEDD